MPYKDPRVQLNLKLTLPEYAALAAEAEVADTEVAPYARHLVVQRQAQPLSKAAHHERQEARRREAALRQQMEGLREQIRTLEEASADRARWRQRAHALEMELAETKKFLDSDYLTAHLRQLLDEQDAAKRAAEQAAAEQAPPPPTPSEETGYSRRRTRRSS